MYVSCTLRICTAHIDKPGREQHESSQEVTLQIDDEINEQSAQSNIQNDLFGN